jgi:mono/diheme cytochrome c family protein
MKKFLAILGTTILITLASTVFGEVEIKEVPLKWAEAATSDGDVLFHNLCASCHGTGGKGDGPAASALKKNVVDLTVLSVNNNGVYPHKKVESAITGKARVVAHGTTDMPVWGQLFLDLRRDWKPARREAFAHQQIQALTTHIESLQAE